MGISKGYTNPNPSPYIPPKQTTYNTDPNRTFVSQPAKAPANTNTDPGGIKIPEFLQKNRHNK